MAIVERQVEEQHVDARLAEEPELAAFGERADELRHVSFGMPRSFATRGHLEARPPARCAGSSPDADDVTRSTGTGRPGVLLLRIIDRLLHGVDQLLVGRPEVRAAGVRGIVARAGRRRPRAESSPATRTPGR